MKRIPIIIDTDPGIDDFFCLALGCTYDDVFDLKTVTTIGGNNYTDVTTQNALNILNLFHKDIPVARGADSFLKKPFGEPVVEFHGENGIGNITLETSPNQIDALPAWDKIYEVAKEENGELILVTVAPLTNIALALQKYPDLPQYIKKIVMMGGSITKGNLTPYAEANTGNDPEASDIVFSSNIPIDMIGLNVTSICPINLSIFESFDNNYTTIMKELIKYRKGDPMHDAIAISTLIDNNIMTWSTGTVHIVVEDNEHKGQTVLTENTNGIHRVATKVDTTLYNNVIKEMITRL